MFMEWLSRYSDFLVALSIIAGFLIWVKNSIGKEVKTLSQNMENQFKAIDDQFKIVKSDLKEIKDEMKSIDRRLTRLEGRFDERGYWEAKIRIDESKKTTI